MISAMATPPMKMQTLNHHGILYLPRSSWHRPGRPFWLYLEEPLYLDETIRKANDIPRAGSRRSSHKKGKKRLGGADIL